MGGRGTGKGYTRQAWPATFWFHVVISCILTLAAFALAVREFILWNAS